MDSNKEQQVSSVKGTVLTVKIGNKCGEITEWLEVTPLELRLTLEARMNSEKIDFEAENQCCICQTELYENLGTMSLNEVIKKQLEIFNAKIEKTATRQQFVEGADLPVVKLSRCNGQHFYHKECLEQQFKSSHQSYLKCAACQTVYGIQIGSMPNGTMKWDSVPFRNMPLEGFTERDCPSTIVIDYMIPSAVKDGVKYHGTQRVCYLPGNQEGQEVLTLLAEAFRRRLIFKVGTSLTTGAQNSVVWEGIHHKTSPSGGSTSFGFPDPTYFQRVKGELEARGLVYKAGIRNEDPKKGVIKLE